MVQEKCLRQSKFFLLTACFVEAHVIQMALAFAPGYDPALELATHSGRNIEFEDDLDELAFGTNGTEPTTWSGHLRRREQDWIDRIVHGAETGHYFVLLGPKVGLSEYSKLQ